MNGVVTLTNMRALNVEVLNTIRDKNMFIFGSTAQKTVAFQKFLGMNRSVPVSTTLAAVFNFLELERDKCSGFNKIIEDIITKQILGLQNLKLAANLLLDFDDYVAAVSRSTEKFFNDRLIRSESFTNLHKSAQGE